MTAAGADLRRLVQHVWGSPTLMTWASLFVRIGGLALLLPIVLVRLDAPEVLVWQMLSTITLLMSWADFGFSPTFGRIIAFTRGGGRLADLHLPQATRTRLAASSSSFSLGTVLAAQRRIYRRLILGGMALAAIGGSAALLRPISALAAPAEGWLAWGFTLGSGLLLLMNGAQASTLTGFDRIADTRRRDAMIGALQLGTTALVTLVGAGLAVIVACYSAWLIPLYLLNWRHARRLGAPDPDASPQAEGDVLAAVWPAAWRSGVGIVMSAGIIQASGLVYAQFAAPASAAAYLLALRAMTAASQLSQAPFYSKLPAMARLRGERQLAPLLKLATRGMALAQWTFVAGALAVIFVAPPLLHLIGSSVTLPGFPMLALLTAAFFVERYSAMHLQLYSLTNHIVWHIANGVTGTLMIGLFLALRPLIGDLAMPAAMLAAYGGFCAWYASRLSLRSLEIGRWDFERRTAFGPAAVLLLPLVAYAAATIWR
jgi:hypothetical protein